MKRAASNGSAGPVYKPRLSARAKRMRALEMFLGLILAVIVLAPVV